MIFSMVDNYKTSADEFLGWYFILNHQSGMLTWVMMIEFDFYGLIPIVTDDIS